VLERRLRRRRRQGLCRGLGAVSRRAVPQIDECNPTVAQLLHDNANNVDGVDAPVTRTALSTSSSRSSRDFFSGLGISCADIGE